MKESRPRRSRLRLDPKSYTLLRQQVLERDGWSCQYCGRREQLEGHHMRWRAQLGGNRPVSTVLKSGVEGVSDVRVVRAVC
jgi:5-methylcytosine-specific restriction endonuclease McrA